MYIYISEFYLFHILSGRDRKKRDVYSERKISGKSDVFIQRALITYPLSDIIISPKYNIILLKRINSCFDKKKHS